MTIVEVDLEYAKSSYKKFHDEKKVTCKGCFIPNKKPRKDGYVRYTVPKGSTLRAFGKQPGEKTYYIHHLAWYVNGREVPENSNTMQLSHLCDDPRCFNVDHIVLETPKQNNSRKNCGVMVQCPCPCQHKFLVCDHEPKCIA